MTIELKTNGYKAEDLQTLISLFNKAAENLFGECSVKHFYYGDELDMITVVLPNRNYAYFNLSKKRVSFNGHTCTNDEYNKFVQLTYNDNLYGMNGRLIETAIN